MRERVAGWTSSASSTAGAACGLLGFAEWLAWRCGLSPRAAREHVRVARRLGELPLIHGAFACGELSYAKVRALVRVAEPRRGRASRAARHLAASQLERAIRAYRRVSAQEANVLADLAYAGYSWDEDGSLIFALASPPEEARSSCGRSKPPAIGFGSANCRRSAAPRNRGRLAAAEQRRGAGGDGRANTCERGT